MTTRHVVTGGSGFVGRRLATALRAAGERVVVFDLEEPQVAVDEFVPGDIRDPAALRGLRLGRNDVVHHLAARQFQGGVPASRHRDAWFADVNVTGTRLLLDAMAAGGTNRLVFFSTDMTYGRVDSSPVSPDHHQSPIGSYGRSKLAAERLIAAAVADGAMRATVFRPRLIAGAGRLGILAKLFRLIDLGLPVPMIGSGRNRYQMIAVEDCVAAALRAVERGLPVEPLNLGSHAPPTVRELLGQLIRRIGSRSILIPTPAGLMQATLSLLDRAQLTLLYPEQFAIADVDYVLDTERTRHVLGWAPSRGDSDILFDAFAHFRARSAPVANDIPGRESVSVAMGERGGA